MEQAPKIPDKVLDDAREALDVPGPALERLAGAGVVFLRWLIDELAKENATDGQ